MRIPKSVEKFNMDNFQEMKMVLRRLEDIKRRCKA